MREQTRDRGDRDMRGDNEGLANGGRRPRRRGCTYCSDDAVRWTTRIRRAFVTS